MHSEMMMMNTSIVFMKGRNGNGYIIYYGWYRVIAFFISKSNIKITIAYKHQPDVDKITQLEVDENSAQDKLHDDVIAEVQRILGGGVDGD